MVKNTGSLSKLILNMDGDGKKLYQNHFIYLTDFYLIILYVTIKSFLPLFRS